MCGGVDHTEVCGHHLSARHVVPLYPADHMSVQSKSCCHNLGCLCLSKLLPAASASTPMPPLMQHMRDCAPGSHLVLLALSLWVQCTSQCLLSHYTHTHERTCACTRTP